MAPDFLLLLAHQPFWLVSAVFVLGLLIGSFLNVVIHRLPRMLEADFRHECANLDRSEHDQIPRGPTYNLVVPRSACPSCGTLIAGYDNIPVLSWLLLRGKCRHCKAPISVRYPLVELITGLISAGLAWHYGWGLMLAGALLFAWVLIALFMIDLDTFYLPDNLTLSLLWLGLLFNLYEVFVPLKAAVLGAAAGYLTLWGFAKLYELIRRQPGMGNGDFKLLAAIGAWLGVLSLPAVIVLSALVGSLIGISLILAGKRSWTNQLPFGPYLAGAGLAALLLKPYWMRLIWGV
ncbi:prepilin peptidase [Chitinimonas lacunae]|uniref:Prepilin leader peptidase/N-methyltransferase n=1 Tax=Chitinimonas lacunae TaxID=1963018 RepID=A0ABV8MRH5_9NEIS